MKEFKFIHAADLHLDVPMKNLPLFSSTSSHATFNALENLYQFTIKEKPDALLLSGDIWNHEDASLKARLAIKEMCEKLHNFNIQVYIAHGNHDPLDQNFKYIQWPNNVHVFNEKVESKIFKKDDVTIAYIHGISHTKKRETANLSLQFQTITEKMKKDHFHIFMLHTSLNKNDGEAIYAPCSLAELKDKNPHYWALGHAHKFQKLEINPLIIYSGALQGTHINEENEHGCVLVKMKMGDMGQGFEITHDFIPLSPLVWKKFQFNIQKLNPSGKSTEAFHNHQASSTIHHEDNLEQLIDISTLQSVLLEEILELADSLSSTTKQLILELTLINKSILNKKLRNINIIQELIESLNEHGKTMSPNVFIKDIKVETSDIEEEKNIQALLKGDDFLAQVLQEAENLLKAPYTQHQDKVQNSEDLLEATLEKIYHESPILKQHKKIIPMPTSRVNLERIVKKAQYICADTLESDINV